MLQTAGRDRFKCSDHPRVGAKQFDRVPRRRESQAGFQRDLEDPMNFRQYSVFDQPHGYCGWYNR